MIASLCNQSVPPVKILLFLPEKDKKGRSYHLPGFLKKLPLLEIVRVEKDQGPATKWFYLPKAVSISNITPVIVLDDDQVYPYRLVEYYLWWHEKQPGVAFTLLGWNVPPSLSHNERKLVKAAGVRVFGIEDTVSQPEQVDCVQGASSFMFTKEMLEFDESYFEELEAAHFADDILVSGLLAKKGTPVLVAPGRFRYARLQTLKHVWGESLFRSVNRTASYNNDLYRVFENYWPSVNKRR